MVYTYMPFTLVFICLPISLPIPPFPSLLVPFLTPNNLPCVSVTNFITLSCSPLPFFPLSSHSFYSQILHVQSRYTSHHLQFNNI